MFLRRYIHVCILLFAVAANGALLRVPEDYASLDAALEAAAAGDTIVLGEGSYPGGMHWKAGVSLQGQGADSTAVIADDFLHPVVHIASPERIELQGITFAYADPPKRAARVQSGVVVVENSDVLFKECTFENGSSNGLYLLQGSQVFLQACTFRRNNAAGMRCSGEEIAIDMHDCAFIHNKGLGAYLEMPARVSGENNRFSENGAYGLSVSGAEIQLHKNHATQNAKSGFYFYDAITGAFNQNQASENGGNGLLIAGEESILQVEGGAFNNNTNRGIFLSKACADISSTTCNDNTRHGISINAEHESIRITGNTCVGNGGMGIWFHYPYAYTFEENTYWENDVIPVGGIAKAVAEEDFGRLESLATQLRTDKKRFRDGSWPIQQFYEALGEYAMQDKATLKHFKTWRDSHPKSITARVALAKANYALGDAATSHEYSEGYEENDWSFYYDQLDLACTILEGAVHLEEQDPYCYELLLEYTYEKADYEPGFFPMFFYLMMDEEEPEDPKLEEIFTQGVGAFPAYTPLYSARLDTLSSRWYDTTDTVRRFCQKSYSQAPEAVRDEIYAKLASELAESHLWDDRSGFVLYGLQWRRIQQGCETYLADYPEAKKMLDLYAYMACAYRDKKAARDLFERIGREEGDDPGEWYDYPRYAMYEQWANGKRSYPAAMSYFAQAILSYGEDDALEALREGADMDAISEYGIVPMSMAIEEEYTRLVKKMIRRGADVNGRDFQELTPLHYAVNEMSMEFLKLLVEAEADINAANQWGATPLHDAVELNWEEGVLYLLAQGADINARRTNGRTPLWYAARDNQPALVQILLEAGADTAIENQNGLTPLAAARQWGAKDTVPLLEAAAAPSGH